MSDSNIHEKLWSLIEPIKVGMLSTLQQGTIHSRPMHTIQDQFEGELLFFLDVASAKAQEILREPSVSVTYACPEKGTYVALSGKAEIIEDDSAIEEHWNRYVQLWFPEKVDQARAALVKVRVDYAEYWDSHSRLTQAFRMAKAVANDERPKLGENRKVRLAQ